MKPITHHGRLVSDDEIQALADEAEAGFDLSLLKRRPARPALGDAPAQVFPWNRIRRYARPNGARPAFSVLDRLAASMAGSGAE